MTGAFGLTRPSRDQVTSQPKIIRGSLEGFALTGRLGGASLGDARWEVQARLGVPTDWAAGASVSRATIWKFGDIELHFDADDRLSLFHCDDYAEAPLGGALLHIDPWVIRAGLTLGKLARALYDAGIDVTSRPDPFNPGWVELTSPAGVRFSTAVSIGDFSGMRPILSCGR